MDLSEVDTKALELELKRRNIRQKASSVPFPGKTITSTIINSSDFDSWIIEVFGKNPEIACAEEAANDTNKVYSRVGEGIYKLDEFENPIVEAFLFGDAKKTPNVRALLEYLCKNCYILAGNYTLEFSW